MNFLTQSDFLKVLKSWGFLTNPLTQVVKGIDKIEEQHKKIENLRSGLDYDIDGLVFKVNNLNYKKVGKHFKFSEVGYSL